MTAEAVLCAIPESSIQRPRLKSCLCTQSQLESAPFREWVRRMGLTFKHHRKLWEFAFIAEALEQHLTHEPTRVSKSRIKRLRGLSQPQYRLRVGDIRVFYDVTETQVQILAIVTKAEAQNWLNERGTRVEESDEGGTAGEDQG